MYKHYIRVNGAGEVIAAFSNAFQSPQVSDICITPEGTDERHFNLNLTEGGVFRYVWNGIQLVERSTTELAAISEPVRTRAAILVRLADLDNIVQRSVVDLYNATGYKPHPKVAAAIDEKIACRGKL